MILRYVLSAIAVLATKLLVYPTAPVLALCVRYYPENKYPVATRLGIPRPHLWPWLRWAQTFDDALDSYWWWESKSAWLRKWWDQDNYDNNSVLRWYCRVLWLWRNNSYGLAYSLGFNQEGINILRDDDFEDRVWDRKIPCSLLRKADNYQGKEAFLYRARFPLFFGFYYEVVLGWKIPWKGYNKAMLATRFFKIGRFKK